MSVELGAALISIFASAGVWFVINHILDWLSPAPRRHLADDGAIRIPLGIFVISFAAYIVALMAAIVLVACDGVPVASRQPRYHDFFAAAATVLVGLLIAFAIARRDHPGSDDASEIRSDVVQIFALVALGELLSAAALLPLLPRVVFGTALITVPATLVAATLAITLFGFASVTPSSGTRPTTPG